VSDPQYALAPPSQPSLDLQLRIAQASLPPPRLHPTFVVAGVLAIGSFLVGMPLLSLCVLATSSIAAVVAGSTSRLRGAGRQAIAPDAIISHEAREAYRGVLIAFAEIERVLVTSTRLRSSVAPVLERGRAAVLLCGRTAVLANPLQQYLDRHDPVRMRAELERLRSRAEAATDDQEASSWSHATAARARQLSTYEEMRTMRDRIVARIELVRATLESFAATIVRLQAVDEEQLLHAGESMAEHLDGVDDELAALESALATDLAA
jgi:hypothetical protein